MNTDTTDKRDNRLPIVLAACVLVLAGALVAVVFSGRGDSREASTTATTPAATPTTPSAPSIPQCATSDLSGSLSMGSPGAGSRTATLVLTNTSGETCQTYGYPGLGLLAADGSALPSDVVWGGPGDPGRSNVELAPGGTASAALTWSAMPGTGDATSGPCQPGATTLEVTPPNEDAALDVPFGQSVCEQGHIDVTALVAGSTGP